MLTVYVILDGFDIGVGIISPFVAKTNQEKQMVLASIGPVWDGNEVWLLAGGGLLFAIFPAAYASSFSGFYLAFFILLWILILRGLSIELRGQVENALWTNFWDKVFFWASVLMALVFGLALGNLLRGLPIGADHNFFLPLWTNFMPSENPGIFDWFTLAIALLSLVTISSHGASYLAMKTDGLINTRSRSIAHLTSWVVVILIVVAMILTRLIYPEMLKNYYEYPIFFILPLISVLALACKILFHIKKKDSASFIASCALIVGLLTSVAFTMYPNLLISNIDTSNNLTIYNAATTAYGQRVALIWFPIGIILATGYTVYIYRSFRGKVKAESGEEVY